MTLIPIPIPIPFQSPVPITSKFAAGKHGIRYWLERYGHLSLLDSSSKPIFFDEEDLSYEQYEARCEWVDLDYKARAVIYSTLSPDIRDNARHMTTTSELWKHLEMFYKPEGKSVFPKLLGELFSCSQADFDSLNDYIGRIHWLHQRIVNLDAKLQLDDRNLIQIFIRGLTSDFQDWKFHAYLQYDLFGPTTSFDEIVQSARDNEVIRSLCRPKPSDACTFKACKAPHTHATNECYFKHPNLAPAGWNGLKRKRRGNTSSQRGKIRKRRYMA